MYKVEYLLLVDKKNACNTVEALMHLLQSDADIVVGSDSRSLKYKNALEIDLNVIKGSVEIDIEQGGKTVYFDMTFICRSKKDLQSFSAALRAIRKVTAPILPNPAALQVLWDDASTHYASLAYPLISATENRMRKLITKFMHINVGIAWVDERIPDDVQKSINVNNSDNTYLYNVDFIKLKDILLSESYARDRDALIKRLKSSGKSTFKKEEINSLIPTSNWEKYFSSQVNFDSEELASIWTKLYDLRCKVAHNKTFTIEDLNDCQVRTKKLNPILDEAISKLDDIHIDKDEAQVIVEDVVSTSSRKDSVLTRTYLTELRRLTHFVFELSTPLQPQSAANTKDRNFLDDVRLLRDAGYINQRQYLTVKVTARIRNELVHKMNNADVEELESSLVMMREINDHFSKIVLSLEKKS
jgi:hypothetical protein